MGCILNEVRRLIIHGGSLRLYLEKSKGSERRSGPCSLWSARKGSTGWTSIGTFARKVEGVKTDLLALLRELRAEGKRIAAYGAAAKGATLINYVGIGSDLVDFVVDRNSFKQGRYMPGQHLPILRAREAA